MAIMGSVVVTVVAVEATAVEGWRWRR